MKKNKILAVLLAAVMMFTMLGATAWADTNVAQIGDTGYTSLKAAVKAAQTGDTIKLISDIELDQSVATPYEAGNKKYYYWIATSATFTLDLNGHNISLSDAALTNNETATYNEVSYWLFYLYKKDSATPNVTVTGDGTIDLSTNNNKLASTVFRLKNGANAKLTINGGTFISSNSEMIYADYGNNDSVIINDGTFKFTTGDPTRIFNCAGYSNFAFTIYGGEFEGFDPSNMEGGSMLATDYIVRSTTVNGIRVYTPTVAPTLNRFTAEADYTNHDATADMLSLTINNIGTYTEATKTTVELYLDDTKLTTSEATVAWSDTMSAVIVVCGSNDVSSSWNTTYVNTDAWTTTTIPNKVKITIGNYDPFWVNIEPSTTDLVVGGYTYENATDMFKGELAKFDMFQVATFTIGDTTTSYTTLTAAVEAANDAALTGAAGNYTVTLLKDTTENGIGGDSGPIDKETFKDGKVLTIDLNNHSYTIENPMVGSKGFETSGMQLLLGNTITIQNGTINTTDESDAKHLIQNYADLTLKNVTLDGSKLAGSKPYTLSNGNGTITIENSKVIAPQHGIAFDVYVHDVKIQNNYIYTGTVVNVKNSTITGMVEISRADRTDSPTTKLVDTNGKDYVTQGIYIQLTDGSFKLLTDTDSAAVARIDRYPHNGSNTYTSIITAVADARPGDTVTLLKDTTEGGIIVGTAPSEKKPQGVTPFPDSNKPLTIDLNGHTYTIGNPAVGSEGFETNGMQLLAGNHITIKNGTIKSTQAKHLIQNYANLTLDSVTLDGSQLLQAPDKQGNIPLNYTLSNGCGNVTIQNSSKIIASPNGYAFDIFVLATKNQYVDPKVYLYNSTKVTVADSTIIGLVEFSGQSTSDPRDGLTYTFTSKVDGSNDQEYSPYDIYEQITEANKQEGEVVGHFHIASGAAWTLTFDLDGGSMKVNDITYDGAYRLLVPAGNTIDLSKYTPYKSGYSFAGWYLVDNKEDTPTITNDDGTGEIIPNPTEQPITSIEVGNEQTIIAHWTKNSGGGGGSKTYYTVTFNTNGGSKIANQTVRKNNTVEKPADPTRSGYEFAGWYSDSSLKTKFDFATKITKTTNLYAAWDKADETGKDDNQGNTGSDKTKTIILTLNSCEAIVFGQTVTNDVPPLAANNRVNMPTRFVAENLSCTVHWDKATGLITIKGTHFTTGEEVVITLTVGSNSATVNGKTVALDTTTFVKANRIYTPLRFVAENLGATVDWNSTTQKITITIPA